MLHERLLRPDDEKRCSTALEVSRTGTFCWQAVDDEHRWDHHLCALFDVDAHAPPGSLTGLLARLHEADRERLRASLDRAVAEGHELDLLVRVLLSDGRVRWLNLKAKAFGRDEARPYVIGALTDITAFKVVEEELILARRMADEASQAKSQFLANVSHEIRTPLTAILGFAQLLVDSLGNDSPAERHARRIVANATQLEALVTDILDYEVLNGSSAVLELAPVALAALVEELGSTYRALAARKGLAFETVLVGEHPAVIYTDPSRLRRIVAHVLENAVKFTIRGTIRVLVQAVPSTFDPRFCTVDVVVVDTGIGISEDEAARIFQPFTQADETTTRLFGGAGLGLALARTLAQSLGGDVTLAQSRPGHGSTFRISLKALLVEPAAAAAQAGATAEAEEGRPLAGLSLLVVEDQPEMQQLLEQQLRALGAGVALADDGDEALRLAAREAFDLVLMDLQMPRLDGYSALKLLRSAGVQAPVVALTCHAAGSIRQATVAAGFDAFLIKPLDRAALVAMVRGLVRPPEASGASLH